MMVRLMLLSCAVFVALYADVQSSQVAEQRKALSELQAFVGEWRGVGQVRRGSSQGAWTETAEVIWKLNDKAASLILESPKAKVFRKLQIQPTGEDREFRVSAALPNGQTQYRAKLSDDGVLTLIKLAEPGDSQAAQAAPDRLQARLVASGKRLVVLYERKAGTRFTRLAEVGFTRKGSGFGKGTSFVECIVTGGEGTIAVRYEGKTFYVCCSGCKEYFDDDPAKAVSEYFARKAEEKKQAEQARKDG